MIRDKSNKKLNDKQHVANWEKKILKNTLLKTCQ